MKLLLVEDDPNLGTVMQEYLKLKGWEVVLARDGEEGWSKYQEEKPNLLILDIMMPKMDGITLGKKIREKDEGTPIIFLTAKNMLEDKAEAFGLGGDDYLTKPFSMEELLMRVKALVRRADSDRGEQAIPETFQIGSFTFHVQTRQLEHPENGGKRLTSREAELLTLLCQHLNKILVREEALKKIWGDDSYFNARSMDVFITRLRKYLKSDERVSIMNVHGKGYKLLVT